MCSVGVFLPRLNIFHLQNSAQHTTNPSLHSTLHTHHPLAIHIFTDPQRQPTRAIRSYRHCQHKGVVIPTSQSHCSNAFVPKPINFDLVILELPDGTSLLALLLGQDSSCTSRLSGRFSCRLAFRAAGISIFHCFSLPLRPVSFLQQKTEPSPAPMQNTSLVKDCLCGHLNSPQPIFYS
jgi:hypothetical protein